MAACPAGCTRWARDYLGYCLCTSKDAASLALGLLSVVSWGVAEIPQIVTNYKTKSTEGLSFAFLVTWIIGDLFNVFGCILEPATLPTQFYMALLYAVTTLTLILQAIYYGHIYPRLKSSRRHLKGTQAYLNEAADKLSPIVSDSGEEQDSDSSRWSNKFSSTVVTSPIPLPALPRSYSDGRDSYYTSARSLSTSHTPTLRSFLAQRNTTSSDSQDNIEEPLLGGSLPTNSTHSQNPRNLLCLVPAVTLGLHILNIFHCEDRRTGVVIEIPRNDKRKLLQVSQKQQINSLAEGHGGTGTYLGWAMAAIYMGGRLPQICLNIRRRNVEGLNPFMFIFALLGNTTYVASILVNSLDWAKVSPNLPWLVDAGGCALLDSFILIQFIYFHHCASTYIKNRSGHSNCA